MPGSTRRAPDTQVPASPPKEGPRRPWPCEGSIFFLHRAQESLHFLGEWRTQTHLIIPHLRQRQTTVQPDTATATREHYGPVRQKSCFGDGVGHQNYGHAAFDP